MGGWGGQRSYVLKQKAMYLRPNSADWVILGVFSVLKHACGAFRVQLRARNASTKCYDLWALITKSLKISPAAGTPFVIWILNVSADKFPQNWERHKNGGHKSRNSIGGFWGVIFGNMKKQSTLRNLRRERRERSLTVGVVMLCNTWLLEAQRKMNV